jgi:hypothetical protein
VDAPGAVDAAGNALASPGRGDVASGSFEAIGGPLGTAMGSMLAEGSGAGVMAAVDGGAVASGAGVDAWVEHPASASAHQVKMGRDMQTSSRWRPLQGGCQGT